MCLPIFSWQISIWSFGLHFFLETRRHCIQILRFALVQFLSRLQSCHVESPTDTSRWGISNARELKTCFHFKSTEVGVRIGDNFVRYVSGPAAIAIAHVSTLVLRHRYGKQTLAPLMMWNIYFVDNIHKYKGHSIIISATQGYNTDTYLLLIVHTT